MTPEMKRRPWPVVRDEERLRYPEVYAAYEAFKQAVRAGKRPDPDRPFITVDREADLPAFADEAEEHEYWGTHSPGEHWIDAAGPLTDKDLPRSHQRTDTAPPAPGFSKRR